MRIYREVKLVIYDCDGVMFESRRANLAYYNFILDKFGGPPIDEKDPLLTHIAHTHTGKQVIDILFKEDTRLDEVYKFTSGLDYTPYLQYMEIEPGLIEMLELLKENYYVAIATNRGITLQTILHRFDLEKYFHYSVTSLDVKMPKPDPECLLKILDHFKLPKEAALYIGDSEIDMETAKNGGVVFIAYKNSMSTPLKIMTHPELKGILGL
ncbi:MAG: HAD-IA family hydrolase [Desulfobacteria bacterium]